MFYCKVGENEGECFSAIGNISQYFGAILKMISALKFRCSDLARVDTVANVLFFKRILGCSIAPYKTNKCKTKNA